MNEVFSVESILFKDTFNNNTNTLVGDKIVNTSDNIVKDLAQAEEDLKFFETYDMLNTYNTNQKIRMLKRLNNITNNIRNKNISNSCESYIRSLEEDTNTNKDTTEKKKNIFIRFFSAIANAIKKFFNFLKEALFKFINWITGRNKKKININTVEIPYTEYKNLKDIKKKFEKISYSYKLYTDILYAPVGNINKKIINTEEENVKTFEKETEEIINLIKRNKLKNNGLSYSYNNFFNYSNVSIKIISDEDPNNIKSVFDCIFENSKEIDLSEYTSVQILIDDLHKYFSKENIDNFKNNLKRFSSQCKDISDRFYKSIEKILIILKHDNLDHEMILGSIETVQKHAKDLTSAHIYTEKSIINISKYLIDVCNIIDTL